MKTITVQEVATDFSAVLRLVQAGQEVEITSRRTPVAKIVPIRKRRRKVDWAGTWARVDAIYGGKPARGKPGSQIIIEARR